MIPISVSDIIKLLEQVPGWKAIVGLPKRLADLERRVSDLEGQSSTPILAVPPKLPSALICPVCGGEMKVLNEKPHIYFGTMGLKVHEVECTACGEKTERDYEPAKGYT